MSEAGWRRGGKAGSTGSCALAVPLPRPRFPPPFPGLPLGTSRGGGAGRGVGGGCVAERRPRRPRSTQQPQRTRACAPTLVAHSAPLRPPRVRARRGPAGWPLSDQTARAGPAQRPAAPCPGARGSGECHRGAAEKPSVTADDRARGAEPGAGGRRGRRCRSLRVQSPGPPRERRWTGGPGRGGGVRAGDFQPSGAGWRRTGRGAGAHGREGKGEGSPPPPLERTASFHKQA